MPDVSADPRYINVVEDVRSELVIPLLLKDRCIGVFDLESPELDAFNKRHVEILTLLASQAAVAIAAYFMRLSWAVCLLDSGWQGDAAVAAGLHG